MRKRSAATKPDVYAAIFGALAHPARRRILLTLFFNRGSMTAGEIAVIFAHAWQTTTRHLQVLEAAGLISHERHGRVRLYRLQRKPLALVTEWLAHFESPIKGQKKEKAHARKEKIQVRKARSQQIGFPRGITRQFRERRAAILQAQRRSR